MLDASLQDYHATHSADEGGDKGDLGLGTGDGLGETEQKGQVAAAG